MEEEKISVEEMLTRTVDMIENIYVPVSHADQIARPLCQAVANLNAVLDAIRERDGDKDV